MAGDPVYIQVLLVSILEVIEAKLKISNGSAQTSLTFLRPKMASVESDSKVAKQNNFSVRVPSLDQKFYEARGRAPMKFCGRVDIDCNLVCVQY